MKRLVFLLLYCTLSFSTIAQTLLKPGELFFTTLNSDGSDSFEFVCLIDLEIGTQIYFTEKAWSTNLNALTGSEGTVLFTAETAISAGTTIVFNGNSDSQFQLINAISVSNSGDTWLAYIGTPEQPSFIAGIGWGKSNNWLYTGTNDSDIPPGISPENKTIVQLGTADNYQISSSINTTDTKNRLAKILTTPTNFVSNNDFPFAASNMKFTILPEPVALQNASFEIISKNTPITVNEAQLSNFTPIFSLKITDGGADNLPVALRKFVIEKPAANTLNWLELFATAMLTDENKVFNGKIFADSVVFNVNFDVPDKETGTLIFGIKLNENLPKNISGKAFECAINTANIETDYFSTFPVIENLQISNTDILFRVEAEKLTIENQIPNFWQSNTPLKIQVCATNTNGLIDHSFTNEICLTVNETTTCQLAQAGCATFEQFRIMETGLQTITASSNTWQTTHQLFIEQVTDSNSIVFETEQPTNLTISSLSDSESNTFELISFYLTDLGTSDFSPTSVYRFKLFNALPENSADWSDTFEGFSVWLNNETGIPTEIYKRDEYVRFTIAENVLQILNGQTAKITVKAWLKKKTLKSGSVIQAKIPMKLHGFEAFEANSQFSESFATEIKSNLFEIEVKPTQFNWLQVPAKISLLQPFSISATVTDRNKNIANLPIEAINLSVFYGTGNLQNTGQYTSENGVFTWNNLIYTIPEIIKLQLSSPGITGLHTELIPAFDTDSKLSFSFNTSNPNLNAKQNNIANSFNIGTFELTDLGTADGIKTEAVSVSFEFLANYTEIELQNLFAGFLLITQTDSFPVKNFTFNNQTLTLTFYPGNFSVENALHKQFAINAYFNKQIPNSISTFNLKFLNENTKLAAHSSGLSLTQTNPISDHFKIIVDADLIRFADFPIIQYIAEPAQLQLKITDINFNTAQNFTGIAKLKWLNTNIILFEEELPINFGEAIFNKQIQYFTDSIACVAAFLPFVSTDTLCFKVRNNYQTIFAENFEKQTHLFELNNAAITDINPITGLKSAVLGIENKVSAISTKISNHNLNSGTYTFKFSLKNGDFDPSSSNFFYFALIDSGSLKTTDWNGYAIGVNATGTDDNLSVWLINKGTPTQCIFKSTYQWDENETANLEILRESSANWKLYLSSGKTLNSKQYLGNFESDIYSNLSELGMLYQFTSTNAEKLLADNFSVERINEAPEIQQISTISENEFAVRFSEEISSFENLIFWGKNSGKQVPISTKTNKNSLICNFTSLPSDTFTISVENLSDLENAMTPKSQFEFVNLRPAKRNDLLITEIFADPTPALGLPELEYIEIYNNLPYPVNISEYQIKVNTSTKILPPLWLPAKKYAVIAHTEMQNQLPDSILILPLEVFPTLVNKSGIIKLLNKTDKVIDSISYNESMYGISLPGGGISLERIDLNNTCGTYTNWSASAHELGGTPGFTNSIANQNTEKFAIKSIYAIGKNTFVVQLTDLPDTLNFIPNFDINTNSEPISCKYAFIENSIRFETTAELQVGKTYELNISNLAGYCNMLNDTSITFSTPNAYDIIFTEIRFKSSNKVDLPNTDYIEIYNRSALPIQTAGMQLQIGDKKYPLPNILIAPGEYCTIMHKNYSEKFNKLGKTIAISNFPDLGNTSGTLFLLDAGGNILTHAAYSADFFNDKFYYELGYSTELLDINSPASAPENWHESKNPYGGTPCSANSVAAINIDNTSPRIIRVGMINSATLKLWFNEPLHLKSFANLSAFTVTGTNIIPTQITASSAIFTEFELQFSTNFNPGEKYKLNFDSSITDICLNKLENNEITFELPQIPKPNEVIINELLFNPIPESCDFIELFNNSEKTFDLSNLFFAKRAENGLFETSYAISTESYLFKPQSFVAISTCAKQLPEIYRCENPDMLVKVSELPSLPDDKGTISLLTNHGTELETVNYSEKMHSAFIPYTEGFSLERISTEKPANQASNWHTAASTVRATPAAQNSQYKIIETPENVFSVNLQIFSPDNDGYDDIQLFNVQLPDAGYFGNIIIVNNQGSIVKYLKKNQLFETTETIIWNGESENMQQLPIGIYFAILEAVHSSGNKLQKRVRFVLARL